MVTTVSTRFATGAAAVAVVLTCGAAATKPAHHRQHHRQHRAAVTASLVLPRVTATKRAPSVPGLTSPQLKRLARGGITVVPVPTSGRRGAHVVPLATVGRRSNAFARAAREGRVRATLARVSIASFGRVRGATAAKAGAVDPDVDGTLAWVLTFHADHVELTPDVPVAFAEENPGVEPATETTTADAVAVYDASTAKFLYWALF